MVVSILLMALAGLVQFFALLRLTNASPEARRSEEILAELEGLRAALADAEADVRGYILTGDQTYVSLYRQAALRIRQATAHLRALSATSPTRLDHINVLEPLLEQEAKMLDQPLEPGGSRGPEAAARWMEAEHASDATRRVRGLIVGMEGEEQELVRQRQDGAETSARAMIPLVGLGIAVGISLVGLAGWMAYRDAQARWRANVELSSFFTLAQDFFVVSDMEGRLQRVSSSFQQVMGFTHQELRSRPLTDFVHPDDREACRQQLAALRRGGRAECFEVRLLSQGGRYRWTAWSAVAQPGSGCIYAVGRDVTRQKQAQAEQNALFASMVQSTDDAIIGVDAQGTILSWNPGAERIYGYTAEEAVGQPAGILVPPELAEQREQTRERLRRGESVHLETTRVRKDGRGIQVSVVISPIKDAGGGVIGSVSVTRDITERRQREEELCRYRERLQLAQRAGKIGVWDWHIPSGEVLWDPETERLYGFSPGVFSGRFEDWMRTRHPDDRQQAEQAMWEAVKTGQDYQAEFRILRPDGGIRWIAARGTVLHDEDGEPVRMVGACADITERKLAERELRESEAQLQEFLDNSTALIYLKDLEGRYLRTNRRLAEVFGFEAGRAVGKTDYDLFRREIADRYKANDRQVIEAGQPLHFEETALQADGVHTYISVKFPLRDRAGRIYAVGGISTDITDRKRAEDEIRRFNEELERRVEERTKELQIINQELEAFTYSVSHDLRAPIRHISGFSRILMEDYAAQLEPEALAHLERIRHGAQRMARLVDDLLELSRLGRRELAVQPTDLNDVVRLALEEVKPEAEGRRVEWKIGPLPQVECDAGLMQQVFTNLLSNALKYTRPREPAVIEIGQVTQNRGPVIFVRDNGVGFDMKHAGKLFGVFQRLHRAEDFEGTGIGLATVQRILHKHGGRVWAEGQPGQGATFYFTLLG